MIPGSCRKLSVALLAGLLFHFPAAHGAPEDALRKAVECAERYETLAASFTLTFERSGQPRISERYDVAANEWSFIDGNKDDLDKDVRKAWKGMQEQFGRVGGLVPKDIAATVTEPVLVDATDDTLVYSFVPGAAEGEKPMSEDMIDALERRFIVDRATGCMSGLSMISTRAFKPAPIATITSFRFVQVFERPAASPIPLITGFRSSASGTALFKAFDESSVMTISEIEVLPGS